MKLTVRTATRKKSMRITWEDGTPVGVWFTAKGENKSLVQVQHGKLPTRGELEARKAYWAGRLTALGELLSPREGG